MENQKKNSCAAVILTYNRLHTLKQCLPCVKDQQLKPDEIFVIDNGSNQETREWLMAQTGITNIIIPQNIGPAGGMKTALQTAYDAGYEWIWVMDDDSLPDRHALERLLKVEGRGIGARNSLVLDMNDHAKLVFKLKDFETIDDIKGDFIEDEIMPWNGTLIHREVIRKLGYPKTELFLWGEETEYYYRIKKSGLFDLFTVKHSYHFHPRNAGYFYKGDWDVATHWRAYYFIRNKYTVFLSKFRQNKLLAFFNYLSFLSGMMYYILFFHKDKWKKMKLAMIAASDGLRKNYSRTMPKTVELLKTL